MKVSCEQAPIHHLFKRTIFLTIVIAPFILKMATAQESSNNFMRYYPIGEDPNVCYKTSYIKSETIVFEASPNVKYSFYNNILRGLLKGKQHTQAWFVDVRPQIRMYNDPSYPIKTPTYRFFIGTQHLFRLWDRHFLAVSMESGHYSNGQSMSALSDKIGDADIGNDSLYQQLTPQTNLSQVINRKTGNFCTNLTEIILNYRINKYGENSIPYKISSFKLGFVAYQKRFAGIGNFGSYAENDIRLYGKYRYLLGYEYTYVFKKGAGIRMAFAENIELIQGAHTSVNPIRLETTYTIYPFLKTNTLGFFVSYIYGHDNYNLRFVDAGHQLAVGASWSQFPPFQMKQMAKVEKVEK